MCLDLVTDVLPVPSLLIELAFGMLFMLEGLCPEALTLLGRLLLS